MVPLGPSCRPEPQGSRLVQWVREMDRGRGEDSSSSCTTSSDAPPWTTAPVLWAQPEQPPCPKLLGPPAGVVLGF